MVPQPVQAAAMGDPHSLQNLAPGPFSVPHRGHFTH
jgi:hypothetical protein